jgi:uncharacterized protein YneF (UPF0154 family)
MAIWVIITLMPVCCTLGVLFGYFSVKFITQFTNEEIFGSGD